MRPRKLTPEMEVALDLERLEWVLGLGGMGAVLERAPGWGTFYEGCPDWLESELAAKHGWGATYRTVVTDGGGYQSYPKDDIHADGRTWKLIKAYAHSAETECPVPMDIRVRHLCGWVQHAAHGPLERGQRGWGRGRCLGNRGP